MPNAGDYKKLFLLMSSENDGEVIAAVRAVTRKLKSDGKDWHWLVGHFGSESPAKKADPVKPTRTAYSDFSFGDEEDLSDLGSIFAGDLHQKVRVLHAKIGVLPSSHARFIRGMFGHFSVDPDFSPSPKQASYILDLYKRYAIAPQNRRSGFTYGGSRY